MAADVNGWEEWAASLSKLTPVGQGLQQHLNWEQRLWQAVCTPLEHLEVVAAPQVLAKALKFVLALRLKKAQPVPNPRNERGVCSVQLDEREDSGQALADGAGTIEGMSPHPPTPLSQSYIP